MGILRRLGTTLDANVNSLLDGADSPEAAIAAAIRDLEEALTDLRAGSVRLLAEKRQVESAWREAELEMLAWDRRAELALGHGRDDLARAALHTREGIRREAEPAKAEIDAIDAALAKLAEDRTRVEAKLGEAYARRRSLAARHRSAVDRLKVRMTLDDDRLTEALARFDVREREIDGLEARAEMVTPPPFPGAPKTAQSLAAEIDAMERDARVTAELERLKARRAA